MGDSTGMTIEFLRARLLSERSVSRTARQRAEQLAKRVVELEEQIRVMVIQRKKAEKAAAEVLSILENRERGDFDEVTDSNSDQDDDGSPSKRNCIEENETSTASRVDKSEVEDGLSGSESEVSPSQGRSLSWKGRSLDSHEKQKIKHYRQRQRQHSFTSAIEPSGKHNLGKSCRKIKRRETRSEAEDEPDNITLGENGERGVSHSLPSDKQPEYPQEPSINEMDEVSPHTSVTRSLDDHHKANDDSLYTDKRDKIEEMERVLEQQAKLIGQYEAEENAQREWEEKYNENESSTLYLYEPGNQHGMANTCCEPKEEAMEFAGENTHLAEDAKSSAEGVHNTVETTRTAQSSSKICVPTDQTPHTIDPEKSGSSNGVMATDLPSGSVLPYLANAQECNDGKLVHQYNGILIQDTETVSHEFAFPAQEPSNMNTNSKQGQGVLHGNTETGYHRNLSIHQNGSGIPGSPSGSPSTVSSGSNFSKWQSLEMQHEEQKVRPQSPNRRLGGILQALQHAKASLGQLSGLPVSNPGTLATVAQTDLHARTMNYGSDLDIPSVPTGLFRLPSDSYPQANFSMPNIYGSGLSLASTYPDVGYGITRSEYHQYPTTTYMESRSRVSVGRQYFDPYTTSRTRVPVGYPLSHSQLSTERVTSQNGFQGSGVDLRNELATGDRYNVYGSDGAMTDI